MARGDQLSRQWKIIQALSATRRGKSASQLAETLACHSRTVYRDLEALQQAGFPLYTERKEGKVHWALLDFGKNQLPIPLSLTELMALHFSRNVLKILQGTAIYESLVSLFDKVKATLPAQYLGYLDQMEHSLEVGVKAYKPYAAFKETLTKVQKAVQNHTYIEMDYYTMSRRSLTRRRIAPYQVWFYDETFYLIAYCQMRHEERLFAIDRIRDLTVLEERFEVPAGFDPETFMQHSFGVFRGDPVNVRIRFSPEAAGYVQEKMWHPSQVLEDQPDGSLIFSAEVAGIDEIKYWILKWGAAATVLQPETLQRAVASEAEAILSHHTG